MAAQSKINRYVNSPSGNDDNNNHEKHSPCILQWNMRGMGAQGEQLKDLVKEFNPIAVFLQETKCKFQYLVKLNGYIPIPINNEPYGIATVSYTHLTLPTMIGV